MSGQTCIHCWRKAHMFTGHLLGCPVTRRSVEDVLLAAELTEAQRLKFMRDVEASS